MLKRSDVIVTLLVVAILVAFAIPAVLRAREAARQTECRNNMRLLCLGLANYHDVFASFPQGTVGSSDRSADHRWSFYPKLTPWLEQAAEPPIDYLTDSRDSKNWPLTFEVSKQETFTVSLRAPNGVTCPNGSSDFGEHNQIYAGYVGVTGVGQESAVSGQQYAEAGVWGYDRVTSISEITAKLDQTILLIEAESERDVWLFGGHPTLRWAQKDKRNLGTGQPFGGFHSGFAMSGMVDGSVRKLSNDIDPTVFIQMTQIYDGTTGQITKP